MKRALLFGWLAALLSTACATNLRADDKLALYRAHAGQPVSDFRYFGRINGWTSLGDSAIAVWTKPGEAWLLELFGPCQDIEFTPVIGLTSQFDRVSANFDKVLVRSTGAINLPCRIQTIRPLDVKAIRAAEKTAREQIKQDAQPVPDSDSGT